MPADALLHAFTSTTLTTQLRGARSNRLGNAPGRTAVEFQVGIAGGLV
jgi:hypothetical protein